MTTWWGLISDTHGLVRPEACEALRGAEHILHAGDIGSPEVLERLREIAPVTAVRGNVDRAPWAEGLPEFEVVSWDSRLIYLLHDLQQLDLDPSAAELAAVISGHSHQPRSESSNGVLYVNPGSAGPRRFRLPVAVGRLFRDGEELRSELIELDV